MICRWAAPRLFPAKPALAAAFIIALALAACAEQEKKTEPPAAQKGPEAVAETSLTRISFAELPGWQGDDHAEALAVFRRTCPVIAARPAGAPLDPRMDGKAGLSGPAGAWAGVCAQAERVAAKEARAFFESQFTPYALAAGGKETGLFTGYYEPEFKAARAPGGAYQTPLRGKPVDLQTIDLGAFDPELEGKRIRGRVEGARFVPYPDRASIEAGNVGPGAKPFVWLADPVDAFFLHIQGSGRLLMEDGTAMRVGFAAKNGRPYTPIGRVMAERGFLARENISMQSIRDWLKNNPEKRQAILNENRSYIFFQEIEGSDPALGPVGAAGRQLTPWRSLAVDRAVHGLGALLWLETALPGGQPFRQLMVAQDTGSAIKGPIRGDIFMGSGDTAGEIAGKMAEEGRLFLLLPKSAGAAASLSAPRG
jgi:membrane-bound lytic murein transglycosylase A